MSKEQGPPPQADQPHGVRLTGIHLDVPNKRLISAAQSELVATLTLTPEGVIFDARTIAAPAPVMAEEPAPEANPSPLPVNAPIDAETEKPKAVTLQGKLKSKPQAGRPDSRGKPTAWARFAAHEEEHDGAHLYSTTVHKHTVELALGLEKDAPLTVQGYPHLQEDPGTKRLDTLSVITLLEQPGKPQK